MIPIDVGNEPDDVKKSKKWCVSYFCNAFKEGLGFKELINMIKDEKQVYI